jgi:hypothetical protein
MAQPKHGYMNNPRIRPLGEKLSLTKDQFKIYVKCSTTPEYFIENYIKIITIDEGLISIKLWKFQKEIIRTIHENNRVAVNAARQVGKALALDTPIPTPIGWTTMGELKVGDIILDECGKPTKVTFATETMTDHECYDVTFDNGETIRADAEHLWTVNYPRHKNVTLTTRELIELKKRKECAIGIQYDNHQIEYSEQQLPLDPYLFGLWLGDGHSAGARITCSKQDYIVYAKELSKYKISEFRKDLRCENGGEFGIYDIHGILREMKVRNNKHIPDQYMYSSIEQRISLIQGLMDSDGYCSMQNGTCEFYQKNKTFIEQVREIFSSLGVKTRISEKIVDNEMYYILRCSTVKFNLFRLPRKLERQKKLQGSYQLQNVYIENITRTESVPVRCIQVDSPSHLFLCGKTCIPTHNTTTIAVGYLLWYALFQHDKTVAILAQKEKTATEILSRIKNAYMHLPRWLQQGIAEWNKGSIELENGSKILSESTSSGAIRGFTISLLYLDEFGHVPNNIAHDFLTSVYPTISSGTTAKIIVSSTPRGMNHWFKMVSDARSKRNNFKVLEYDWKAVPTRDKKWEQNERSMLGDKFAQEHEIEFLGSAGTLISATALKNMVFTDPVLTSMENKLKIYENPKEMCPYVITADTSYGKEIDYSAFIVFDVSKAPYRIVATYKNNDISAQEYPGVIKTVANFFNRAYVMAESNDIGAMMLQILTQDMEYEHIFYTNDEKTNQMLSIVTSNQPGLRTTKKTKRIGCNALKTIVENGQLQICDFDTISELTTFIKKKNDTYAADEGSNDDLSMCCVLFAWLTTQPIFKDLVDVDLRKKMFDERNAIMEQELPPQPVRIVADSRPDQIRTPNQVWEIVGVTQDSDYDLYSGFPDPRSFPKAW